MGYKPIDYIAADDTHGSSLRHAEQQGYAAEYLEAQLVALHSKLNEVIDRLNGLFASSNEQQVHREMYYADHWAAPRAKEAPADAAE